MNSRQIPKDSVNHGPLMHPTKIKTTEVLVILVLSFPSGWWRKGNGKNITALRPIKPRLKADTDFKDLWLMVFHQSIHPWHGFPNKSTQHDIHYSMSISCSKLGLFVRCEVSSSVTQTVNLVRLPSYLDDYQYFMESRREQMKHIFRVKISDSF